jgi:hypothetical protein
VVRFVPALFSLISGDMPICVTLDFTQDHAELGAALNGFSLNETGPLSSALEKTGQAVDATYISTARLVNHYF